MKKVLFVCLGNICRSPVAEGVFKSQVLNLKLGQKLLGDSAGTAAYHVGETPHHISTRVAKDHGVLLDHRGRQFSKRDFSEFDFIICMDKSNYENVVSLSDDPNEIAKVYLMRQWEFSENPIPLQDAESVPDPYFGNEDGFVDVHHLLEKCNKNFISYLTTLP